MTAVEEKNQTGDTALHPSTGKLAKMAWWVLQRSADGCGYRYADNNVQGAQDRGVRAALALGSRARAILGGPAALAPTQTEACAEENEARQQFWECRGTPETKLYHTAAGIK